MEFPFYYFYGSFHRFNLLTLYFFNIIITCSSFVFIESFTSSLLELLEELRKIYYWETYDYKYIASPLKYWKLWYHLSSRIGRFMVPWLQISEKSDTSKITVTSKSKLVKQEKDNLSVTLEEVNPPFWCYRSQYSELFTKNTFMNL